MSSPGPNNQAFHGRMITIKTVCQGLPRKNTHARPQGGSEGSERGCQEYAVSFRDPREHSPESRPVCVWTLTHQFPEKPGCCLASPRDSSPPTPGPAPELTVHGAIVRGWGSSRSVALHNSRGRCSQTECAWSSQPWGSKAACHLQSEGAGCCVDLDPQDSVLPQPSPLAGPAPRNLDILGEMRERHVLLARRRGFWCSDVCLGSTVTYTVA